MDITEHKQTQSTLQVSEEQMHLVVENMPIMLNVFDADGNIIVWNHACERITGYSVDEIVGNSKAMEILYPDAAERRRMLIQAYVFSGNYSEDNPSSRDLNNNPIQTWETKLTCKDGQVKTLSWSSVSQQFPIPGWHTWHIGQEISLRKVERTIRDSDNLLISVFDVSKLGCCLTDDRGRFLQVNQAYADLYGYRPEELVGQPFTIVLPSAIHNDAVREYYSLLMTHEEPTLFKRRGEQHRNGQLFDVQIMASRVILEDRRRLLISIVSKWLEK
jgi:PAS domain S-box-containing protein